MFSKRRLPRIEGADITFVRGEATPIHEAMLLATKTFGLQVVEIWQDNSMTQIHWMWKSMTFFIPEVRTKSWTNLEKKYLDVLKTGMDLL